MKIKKALIQKFKNIKDNIKLSKEFSKLTKNDPKAKPYLKEVKKYLLEHKNNSSDKIIKSFNNIIDNKGSIEKYFEHYSKLETLEKHPMYGEIASRKDEAYKNKEDKEIIIICLNNMKNTLISQLVNLGKKILMKKNKEKTIIVKQFTDLKKQVTKLTKDYEGTLNNLDVCVKNNKTKLQAIDIYFNENNKLESKSNLENLKNLLKLKDKKYNGYEAFIKNRSYLRNQEIGKNNKNIDYKSLTYAPDFLVELYNRNKNDLKTLFGQKISTAKLNDECKKKIETIEAAIDIIEKCINESKLFTDKLTTLIDKAYEEIEREKENYLDSLNGVSSLFKHSDIQKNDNHSIPKGNTKKRIEQFEGMFKNQRNIGKSKKENTSGKRGNKHKARS